MTVRAGESTRSYGGVPLQEPDDVRECDQDGTVHLYHRRYPETPVTEKLLLVVVNVEVESPFVVTAFFTDRLESGTRLGMSTTPIGGDRYGRSRPTSRIGRVNHSFRRVASLFPEQVAA